MAAIRAASVGPVIWAADMWEKLSQNGGMYYYGTLSQVERACERVWANICRKQFVMDRQSLRDEVGDIDSMTDNDFKNVRIHGYRLGVLSLDTQATLMWADPIQSHGDPLVYYAPAPSDEAGVSQGVVCSTGPFDESWVEIESW